MGQVVTVDPFRCRMWKHHDRLNQYLTEESCQEEIASFRQHGQLVPALGRRVEADPDIEIELVYGARRLFVARHLKTELKVELCGLDDREAIVAMHIENRHRSDISPYERGLSYVRWLSEGYFSSQDDLARALNVSASQVSRILKIARLPEPILTAFGTPSDICEGWGLELATLLEDLAKRRSILKKARVLAERTPRLAPRVVYRQLIASVARGRKPQLTGHDEIVKSERGMPLFRIRRQTNTIALFLPIDRVSAATLESIRGTVASILAAAEQEDAASSEHTSMSPRRHNGASK